MTNRDWNPETHPYIARWSHPTGDRLTRFWTTIEHFTTRDEAIAAISRPFPANTSDAHCVGPYAGPGQPCPYIADRKRNKKIRIRK